jgi:hypothetical protein
MKFPVRHSRFVEFSGDAARARQGQSVARSVRESLSSVPGLIKAINDADDEIAS